jgi:putative spermidine/putrescine transport system ATP-binding protein
MNEARIQQLGTPAEIYEHPVNRFVADFIGQSNLIRGIVEQSDGETAQVRIASGAIVQTRMRGNPGAGDSVVVSIRPERVEVARLDVTAPSGALHGVVVELVYLGSHNQIVLEATPELRLLVNVTTDSGIHVGDQIVASIPARYATCFGD